MSFMNQVVHISHTSRIFLPLPREEKKEMKQIPNFPDYEICEDGRVWSKPRTKTVTLPNGVSYERTFGGNFVTPQRTQNGYLQCLLINSSGEKQQLSIHRAVATAFVSNPKKLSQVNHLDGDKTNNNYRNLEWVTSSQNQRHKHDVLKKGIGELHGKSILTEEQVRFIRDNYVRGRGPEFRGNGYLLRDKFNISQPELSLIVNNKLWRHLNGN